ncbi:MAG: hypothetical protein ISS48_00065 [Candidatus Aenigmarchaeota archaeon]|nr:hypothetical protein [Candidatus Aenigmarchaeota archaeon]
MVNPFQRVAEKLGELGFYDFLLPWLITSAILWGLLSKSKLFGENAVVINSVLSISISFFIWGFIIFTGSDIGVGLSKFFTQMTFIAIGFAVILIIGSLFFPGDFSKILMEKRAAETLFWIIVIIGIVVLIGSGLFNLGEIIYDLLHSFTKISGGGVGVLMVAVIVLVLLLMFVSIIG